jgi:hypothetical protein
MSERSTDSPASVGWYPDPSTNQLRFWDGKAWALNAPLTTAPTPSNAQQNRPLAPAHQPSDGWAVGLVAMSVVATWDAWSIAVEARAGWILPLNEALKYLCVTVGVCVVLYYVARMDRDAQRTCGYRCPSPWWAVLLSPPVYLIIRAFKLKRAAATRWLIALISVVAWFAFSSIGGALASPGGTFRPTPGLGLHRVTETSHQRPVGVTHGRSWWVQSATRVGVPRRAPGDAAPQPS